MSAICSPTPPFISYLPGSLSPIFLTCEHASRRLPFATSPSSEERSVLASHWGWDIGAWALTRDIGRRMLAYHVPYHAEIDRQLFRRVVRGVHPVLLAVHSFTPVLHHRTRNFDVGVLYDEHLHLARRLASGIRRSGLGVRYNEPYSGVAGMMYAVDRHGSHHDLPCLEIEINHARIEHPSQVRAVADAIAPVLRHIAT